MNWTILFIFFHCRLLHLCWLMYMVCRVRITLLLSKSTLSLCLFTSVFLLSHLCLLLFCSLTINSFIECYPSSSEVVVFVFCSFLHLIFCFHYASLLYFFVSSLCPYSFGFLLRSHNPGEKSTAKTNKPNNQTKANQNTHLGKRLTFWHNIDL